MSILRRSGSAGRSGRGRVVTHGLEIVFIGVDDEGGVVLCPRVRLAVIAAARGVTACLPEVCP